MAENRNYIPQLTFLRFLAAILVVVYHYCNAFYPFNSPYFINFVKKGELAVSFFFFLSGVVLTVSYWEKVTIPIKDFFVKRFARIYPVYFLAFAMVVGFFLIGGSAVNAQSSVYQFLAIHAWIPAYTLDINYPSWSVSVEILFYVLFPFLLLYFKRISFSKFFAITILLYLLGVVQYVFLREPLNTLFPDKAYNVMIFMDGFPLWHLNTFVFGVFGGVLILRLRAQNRTYSLSPFWWWLAGFVIIFFLFNTNNIVKDYSHNGLLSPIFLLICLGLSLDNSFAVKLLSKKPLVYLGNVSYAVYLLQFPVLMLFLKVFKQDVLNQNNFFFYLVFLTVFSCLTYSIYEKKCREFILKISSKKKA